MDGSRRRGRILLLSSSGWLTQGRAPLCEGINDVRIWGSPRHRPLAELSMVGTSPQPFRDRPSSRLISRLAAEVLPGTPGDKRPSRHVGYPEPEGVERVYK